MSINCEPSTLLLPPQEYCCVNCSSPATVSEIHIYSSTDVFERSITILDALCEIFASPNLYLAQHGKFMATMCAKCAESLSYIYQSFMNLLALSTSSCYLTKLLVQVDNWHFQKTTTNIQDETYNLFCIAMNPEENNVSDYKEHIIEPNEENRGDRRINMEETVIGDGNAEISKDCDDDDEIPLIAPKPETILRTDAYEMIAEFPPALSVDGKSRMRGRYISRNINKRRYFKCNQCPAKFIPVFELHEHILSVHESRLKSKCDKCPFTYFPEIIKFDTHTCMDIRERSTVKKSRPFLCEICGARLGGERLLTFHTERVHTQEDIRYKCHYCNKRVVDRHKLFMHMEIHASTKPYLCFQCGKSFSQKRGLDKHLEIHFVDRDIRIKERHEKDIGTFPCNICNRIFSYKRNLQEHQRMHIPETNKFRCPICEKPHWAKKRLEKHILSHNPKRETVDDDHRLTESFPDTTKSRRKAVSLKCSICYTEFKSQRDLVDHQQFTHLNGHPLRCHLCGKSVSGQRNLDVHLRTHMSLEEKYKSRNEGNGAHSCQFCAKVYTSLQDLEVHGIVHEDSLEAKGHPPQYQLRSLTGDSGTVHSKNWNVKLEESESNVSKRRKKLYDRRPLLCPERMATYTERKTTFSRITLPDAEKNFEAELDATSMSNFEEMEGKRAIILIDRIHAVKKE